MATPLPFLYPARLVQRPLRVPAVRRFLRNLHATAAAGQHPASSSPKPSRQPSRDLQHNHIPFELPPDFVPPDGPSRGEDGHIRIGTGDSADGTITPLERQAFRRIFREIAQRADKGGSGRGPGPASPDGSAGPTTGSSSVKRINAIVGEASDEQVAAREQQRTERAAGRQAALSALSVLRDQGTTEPLTSLSDPEMTSFQAETRDSVLAQFPPSLRSAAGKALGIHDGRRQAPSADEEAAEAIPAEEAPAAITPAEAARLRRQEKMELAMLSKKTDVALWEYMEDHVFSLVEDWGLTGDGVTKVRQKKALAANGPLYPSLLLHGQRLLDSHFAGGVTSPLALAVLPRIKSLGLASYVLGASTSLYNHLLHIKWNRQGDAAAVFALLQEMQRTGLPYDEATLAAVQSVEWHILPLVRGAGRTQSRNSPATDDASDNTDNVFVTAALRTLPDLAAVAHQATHWRQEVERRVHWGRRAAV